MEENWYPKDTLCSSHAKCIANCYAVPGKLFPDIMCSSDAQGQQYNSMFNITSMLENSNYNWSHSIENNIGGST